MPHQPPPAALRLLPSRALPCGWPKRILPQPAPAGKRSQAIAGPYKLSNVFSALNADSNRQEFPREAQQRAAAIFSVTFIR